MSELRKDGLTPIIFGITGYYPVFCSRKPIIAGNIQMRNVTDSKTISGLILKVGRSQQYCTNWGEMLFKGKEVIVSVKDSHQRQKIPMYIRDDSDVGILNLTPNTLLNKVWSLNIHGELNTSNQGCIFIDKINLSAIVPKQVNINKYF